jgi:hypothetical protein
MLEPTEIAWLAAAIDGEGTISLGKRNTTKKNGKVYVGYTPKVSVANCCVPFVERACEFFRKATGSGFVGKSSEGKNYPVYKAEVTGQKAFKLVMAQLLPWLLVKGRRAKAVLAWIDGREKLKQSGIRLCGRGVSYGPETEALREFLKNDPLDIVVSGESHRLATRRQEVSQPEILHVS